MGRGKKRTETKVQSPVGSVCFLRIPFVQIGQLRAEKRRFVSLYRIYTYDILQGISCVKIPDA